jgi:hypothetical protein
MILEKQVCSLELSKRLKELGVKQESLFWYTCFMNGTADIYFQYDRKHIPPALCSAFTVAELGELMPIGYRTHKEYYTWYVTTNHCLRCDNEDFFIMDKNEADARAKMLIYLLENGLMELPNE